MRALSASARARGALPTLTIDASRICIDCRVILVRSDQALRLDSLGAQL